jgi:hypothetical protein
VTICEKCGKARDHIEARCPACEFHPKTVRELAIATLLTSQFEAGEESFGTHPETLETLARDIRAGNHPVLNEEELLTHERAVAAFIQITPMSVYGTLFRFFLPAILIIALLWGVLVVLGIVGR